MFINSKLKSVRFTFGLISVLFAGYSEAKTTVRPPNPKLLNKKHVVGSSLQIPLKCTAIDSGANMLSIPLVQPNKAWLLMDCVCTQGTPWAFRVNIQSSGKYNIGDSSHASYQGSLTITTEVQPLEDLSQLETRERVEKAAWNVMLGLALNLNGISASTNERISYGGSNSDDSHSDSEGYRAYVDEGDTIDLEVNNHAPEIDLRLFLKSIDAKISEDPWQAIIEAGRDTLTHNSSAATATIETVFVPVSIEAPQPDPHFVVNTQSVSKYACKKEKLLPDEGQVGWEYYRDEFERILGGLKGESYLCKQSTSAETVVADWRLAMSRNTPDFLLAEYLDQVCWNVAHIPFRISFKYIFELIKGLLGEKQLSILQMGHFLTSLVPSQELLTQLSTSTKMPGNVRVDGLSSSPKGLYIVGSLLQPATMAEGRSGMIGPITISDSSSIASNTILSIADGVFKGVITVEEAKAKLFELFASDLDFEIVIANRVCTLRPTDVEINELSSPQSVDYVPVPIISPISFKIGRPKFSTALMWPVSGKSPALPEELQQGVRTPGKWKSK